MRLLKEAKGTVVRAFSGVRPRCDGRFPFKPLMRPSGMVVVLDELPKQKFKVPLVQDDDMIKKFTSQRPDESLDIGILPRAAIGRPHLFDSATFQKGAYAVSVDVVVVPKEISRPPSERHRLPQLLDEPRHRGVSGGRKVNDLSAAVVEDEKDVKAGEAQGRHCEEIHRQESS